MFATADSILDLCNGRAGPPQLGQGELLFTVCSVYL